MNIISVIFNTTNTSDPIPTPSYYLILEDGDDDWILVSSPNFPEIHTQAKTIDEAVKNGKEALDLILEELGQKDLMYNLILINKTKY